VGETRRRRIRRLDAVGEWTGDMARLEAQKVFRFFFALSTTIFAFSSLGEPA
jgi:hypothetical protein